MKQTAVEWLVEKIIEDELIDVKNGHQFIHLQSIAKEMEKEYAESNEELKARINELEKLLEKK